MVRSPSGDQTFFKVVLIFIKFKENRIIYISRVEFRCGILGRSVSDPGIFSRWSDPDPILFPNPGLSSYLKNNLVDFSYFIFISIMNTKI